MDFSLSEEQQEIQGLARQILGRRAPTTPDAAYPPEWPDRTTWKDLADAGLLGIALPEDVGGADQGLSALALVLEEAGRAVACLPAWATLAAAADPIAQHGTPEQRQRWLPGVVDGSVLLTAALTEPRSTDPLTPATTARPDGDGYRVDGEKYAVPIAELAARVLVPARTPDGATVVLLVDPSAQGVELQPEEATHGEPQSTLLLTDVAVPVEDVLVGPATGAEALAAIVQRSSLGLAAMQLGIAEQALHMTADYVSRREQFGRPIGTFQAVAVRVANAYIDVQAIRSTLQQALWRTEQGLPAAEETATAKFWAAEGGERVLSSSVHLHGGIGVDTDYPLHHYFLWSKHLELALGSATEQLVRLGDLRAEPARS
jgi:3-oxocholest-4-en-26-oyl-CoA dehydrogenase beta subunit